MIFLYQVNMDYEKVKNEICKFRQERDWKQFHNPKDLATAIAIEASELQEKFLWKSIEESYDVSKDEEVHEEFADIMNFMILFAEECNIDVEKTIFAKMKKNSEKYPIKKSKGKSDKYSKL